MPLGNADGHRPTTTFARRPQGRLHLGLGETGVAVALAVRLDAEFAADGVAHLRTKGRDRQLLLPVFQGAYPKVDHVDVGGAQGDLLDRRVLERMRSEGLP